MVRDSVEDLNRFFVFRISRDGSCSFSFFGWMLVTSGCCAQSRRQLLDVSMLSAERRHAAEFVKREVNRLLSGCDDCAFKCQRQRFDPVSNTLAGDQ